MFILFSFFEPRYLYRFSRIIESIKYTDYIFTYYWAQKMIAIALRQKSLCFVNLNKNVRIFIKFLKKQSCNINTRKLCSYNYIKYFIV